MKAHVVEAQSQLRVVRVGQVVNWGTNYRWRCSCGESGPWQSKALSARRGGEQHRAKRENR